MGGIYMRVTIRLYLICGVFLAPITRIVKADNDTKSESWQPKGDEACSQVLHSSKQEVSMLKSLLIANTEQLAAVSNLHRETDLMRRRLDVHQADLKKCKLQLSSCHSDQKSIGTTVADTYTVSTDVLALIDARGQMSNLGTEGLINSLLSTRAAIETRLNGDARSTLRDRRTSILSSERIRKSKSNSFAPQKR
jgi:hypothetical protein